MNTPTQTNVLLVIAVLAISQVRVSSFADAEQPGSAAGGVLRRYQPEPGSELANLWSINGLNDRAI
jgi:hypothetical protein